MRATTLFIVLTAVAASMNSLLNKQAHIEQIITGHESGGTLRTRSSVSHGALVLEKASSGAEGERASRRLRTGEEETTGRH